MKCLLEVQLQVPRTPTVVQLGLRHLIETSWADSLGSHALKAATLGSANLNLVAGGPAGQMGEDLGSEGLGSEGLGSEDLGSEDLGSGQLV